MAFASDSALMPLANDAGAASRFHGMRGAAPRNGNAPARSREVEVVARLCHELRNPLGAVLGFVQLIGMDRSEPLSEAQRGRIHLIEEAGQHMLGIIRDVLDQAANTHRQAAQGHVSADMNGILGAVCGWLEPLAAGFDVTLERHVLPSTVAADPLSIRQVFLNLVSNAIKYNRRGGSVQIRAAAADKPGWVGIEVADSGHGIDSEAMGRLFEPFERLAAQDSKIEGSGVGLTIVRQMVEKMHGRVEVTSEVGVGSVFTVWLPATH